MSNLPIWVQIFEQHREINRSLREQVCDTLRLAVVNGHLPLGSKLPSTRQLASDLGISRVTTEAAYSQLEAEGYVIRKVGDGTFVAIDRPFANLSAAQPGQATVANLSHRGQQLLQGGGCHDPLTPLPFAAGSPDLRAFPLKKWQQLLQKQLREHSQSLLGYGDPQGYLPLRAALAGYLANSRGVKCHPSQIVILTSSQQALQLIATLLLDAGETAWVEDPGYNGAKTAFAAMGAHLVPIPVDDQGMNWETFSTAENPKLIYTTPSHQYPTGAALSLPRRLALLALAEQNHAWIIEDDYDSEFQYDQRPLPAMQGLDQQGRVIYIGTFSKVLFPSLRLAYLVLPPALVSAFVTARSVYDGHCQQLSQAVVADFIQSGLFASHLRQMRQLYKGKRNHFLSLLSQAQLPFAPMGYEGGLQLTLPLPTGSEQSLSQMARQAGIETPGMRNLYTQPDQARDGWVLGYSALALDDMTKATGQLCHLLTSTLANH